MTGYKILLYYKYTAIPEPEKLVLEHKAFCQQLNLKGRVIIASEGINGTLEGTDENVQKYMDMMNSQPLFAKINWKISQGTGKAFPKLSVKLRREIVTTGIENKDFGPLHHVTGQYLSVEQMYEWYKEGKEFYVIDMRNDYEFEVGRFKNSIFPEGLYHFRDVPNVIKKIEHLKNKTIVTVCTGGVRCETASGLLMKYGFNNVYQLEHGIVTFMEKYPNEFFEGKLYVFDQRMTIGFNIDSKDHVSVGKCRVCAAPSEHLVNWNDHGRRAHGIICESCCTAGKVQLQ